jgi:transcriptional regulator with XRE-family HTH domain
MTWNGQTLRQFRKQRSLSQAQIGLRLHVSQQMVHAVEHGHKPLPRGWSARLNVWAGRSVSSG